MAKIVKLKLQNFRKFKDFTCDFGRTDLICLIGRGDSGKSTILDALSYVLSPSWSVQFSDYVFTDCNTTEPFRIIATIVDFPDELVRDDKFALYMSGYNLNSHEVCDLEDEGAVDALVVELTVDDSLEPRWTVLNALTGESKSISPHDRSLLNVNLISDYLNRHFAWANGSPLNSLTRLNGNGLNQETLVSIGRNIRDISSSASFGEFTDILQGVQEAAAAFGVDTGTLHAEFDMRQLSVREGAVCLHDKSRLPLRLRGKGSRRLLSAAIQSSRSGESSIMLIDEVEQGLEPDRVRSFVHYLSNHHDGQVFLTTHSDNALVEVSASSVFWVRGGNSLYRCQPEMQRLIRANPAALFGNKILLCEGETEYGFCRALDDFNVGSGGRSFSHCGTVAVVGRGSEFFRYDDMYLDMGLSLLIFCDSDDKGENDQKERLAQRGARIVAWEQGQAFEHGVFSGIIADGIRKLLLLAIENKDDDEEVAKRSIADMVRSRCPAIGNTDIFSRDEYSADLRKALGDASKSKSGKGGAWFKSVSAGMEVGKIVCENYSALPEASLLKKNIDKIIGWAGRD